MFGLLNFRTEKQTKSTMQITYLLSVTVVILRHNTSGLIRDACMNRAENFSTLVDSKATGCGLVMLSIYL